MRAHPEYVAGTCRHDTWLMREVPGVLSKWARRPSKPSRCPTAVPSPSRPTSAATPMRGVFTRHPDYTPFTALPNRTPLTDGLKTPPSCGVDTPAAQDPKAAAVPAAKVPADKKSLAAEWDTWKSRQRLTGPHAVPDFANPAQMNHLTWYQTHNWTRPYPGEKRIYALNDVPGAYIPSPESDG